MPKRKSEDTTMNAMAAVLDHETVDRSLSGAKSERLAVRATPKAKELIEQASQLAGRTISDFVLETALDRAVKTIADYERVVLSENQRAAFYKALLATHTPSDKARAAARRYKEKFRVE